MNREREGAGPPLEPAGGAEAEALSRVVRHRRHHFPARNREVKVRYDDREHAVLAAAADRAGLTVAGFLAGASLAVAGGDRLRPRRRTGSSWPSCCGCGWRSAGMR